ncbi:hypothetical protein TNCV_3021081, partial [Trichonephila clavipes]
AIAAYYSAIADDKLVTPDSVSNDADATAKGAVRTG